MTAAQVSVMIPAYNGSEWIERAIASALMQDRLLECVVVDDGSTDGTLDIVTTAFAGQPRVRAYGGGSEHGIGINHNRCLALARGELIQILHQDDRLLPGALTRLATEFDDRAVALAHAPRQIDSDDDAWVKRYRRLETAMLPLDRVTDGHDYLRRYLQLAAGDNTIGEPSSVMMRARNVFATGGFRPELIQLSDIEMWLRTLTAGAIAWVPDELVIRSHHSGNQTNRSVAADLGRFDGMTIAASLMRSGRAPADVRRRAARWWREEAAHILRRGLHRQRAQLLPKLAVHIAQALPPAAMRPPQIASDPDLERLL